MRTRAKEIASRVPRPSLAGTGLSERMRSAAVALLGLTAAVCLGLVALLAQAGWPLLAPAPLPNPPQRHGEIAPRVGLSTAPAPLGASPASPASPSAAGARYGSRSGGHRAPSGPDRGPRGSAAVPAAFGPNPGLAQPGAGRGGAAPGPIPVPAPAATPSPAPTPVPAAGQAIPASAPSGADPTDGDPTAIEPTRTDDPSSGGRSSSSFGGGHEEGAEDDQAEAVGGEGEPGGDEAEAGGEEPEPGGEEAEPTDGEGEASEAGAESGGGGEESDGGGEAEAPPVADSSPAVESPEEHDEDGSDQNRERPPADDD